MSEGAASRGFAAAFSDMPLVLKGITSFFVVYGLGSLILALAPGVGQRVAGVELSQAEFFAAGHGAFALVMGAWLTGSALGLLRRARWGCWGTILAYALFVPAEPFFAEPPRVAFQAILALVWAVGAWAYLFRSRGAVDFFAQAPRVSPAGAS